MWWLRCFGHSRFVETRSGSASSFAEKSTNTTTSLAYPKRIKTYLPTSLLTIRNDNNAFEISRRTDRQTHERYGTQTTSAIPFIYAVCLSNYQCVRLSVCPSVRPFASHFKDCKYFRWFRSPNEMTKVIKEHKTTQRTLSKPTMHPPFIEPTTQWQKFSGTDVRTGNGRSLE